MRIASQLITLDNWNMSVKLNDKSWQSIKPNWTILVFQLANRDNIYHNEILHVWLKQKQIIPLTQMQL
jgi:hypothetical protein